MTKIEAILSGRLVWKSEYDSLATYNSECARGILHTEEYNQKMKAIQQEYDESWLKVIALYGNTP